MTIIIFSIFALLRSFSPNAVLCSTDPIIPKGVILQSLDGGNTWQDYSIGLPEEINVNTLQVDNSEILLGTNKGLFKQDLMSKSPKWVKDNGLQEMVRSVFQGHNGKYVVTSLSGLYQNNVEKNTWTAVHKSMKGNLITGILETENGDLVLNCESGVFKSIDQGKTWEKIYSENPIYSLMEKDGTLIGGGSNGMIRSVDHGKTWTNSLSDNGVILKMGKLGNNIFAITSGKEEINQTFVYAPGNIQRKEVFLSSDNGKNWVIMEGSLSLVDEISSLFQIDDVLFSSQRIGLCRSTNNGKSWELILPISSDQNAYYLVGSSRGALYVVKMFEGC